MHQRTMGPEDCEPIDIHLIPRWDRVRQFLISRRSVRWLYQQTSQKREDAANAGCSPLGAQRSEPPGHTLAGDQRCGGGASDSRDDNRLDEDVKEMNAALYQEAKLEVFVEAWDGGKDRISRGAPCVIQAYAPKEERTAATGCHDCHRLLSIGGYRTRFGNHLYRKYQHSEPGLPASHRGVAHAGRIRSFGTFVIGYSAEQYHRIPTRKPADVTWAEIAQERTQSSETRGSRSDATTERST